MGLSEGKLSCPYLTQVQEEAQVYSSALVPSWTAFFLQLQARVIYSKQVVTDDCFLLETCNVRDNSRVLTAGQTFAIGTLACSMYSWTWHDILPCFYLIGLLGMFCWNGQSPLNGTWCSYSHISIRILHHSRRNTHLFHTPQMGARLCHERQGSQNR